MTHTSHTIGGEDLSGSTPHKNPSVSSNHAFRDLLRWDLAWWRTKLCNICTASFTTRRKRSNGASGAILKVFLQLITSQIAKGLVLHTFKSCYTSVGVKLLNLQILGNTDKRNWLSESDTCAVLCLMTGLRGSQGRHGSADIYLDILTWFPACHRQGHRHPEIIPRWPLVRLIKGESNILVTVANITKKCSEEPPRWNLFEDDNRVGGTCRK